MEVFEVVLVVVFCASAAGILLVFVLYPLALCCLALVTRRRVETAAEHAPTSLERLPSVSLLVALRNAEALVEDKLANALALEYPGELELVFVSDGSTDATVARLRTALAHDGTALAHDGTALAHDDTALAHDGTAPPRVEVIELREHLGKAHALNRGAELCRGEILVLSDADALLAPDAVTMLARRFADARVGGAGGQRVIGEARGALTGAQGRYIALDSALKRIESRLGSVTANDGKLYALRRSLFRPIAAGATDDLYACLSVVEQGARFVFEPRARAAIRAPSRSAAHELARRRRIVARSLHGIFLKRTLLNPFAYGSFALQLSINKVLRRCLPVFVGAFFLSTLALSAWQPWARVVLAGELLFAALALVHPLLARRAIPLLSPAAALAFYFCVGNFGTLLGLADFLRGRETIKWDPIKAG